LNFGDQFQLGERHLIDPITFSKSGGALYEIVVAWIGMGPNAGRRRNLLIGFASARSNSGASPQPWRRMRGRSLPFQLTDGAAG
jgi:hypothetical protein